MRLHLSAFAALALLSAPAEAATRNYTVTNFDRVRVDGPYRVELKTGVAPFAKADGSPAALDAVSIEVHGRTLIVRRNSSVSSGSGQPAGVVTISVGTHELSAAWLNGSGGLRIDAVKGQAFDLAVNGSGAAEVGRLSVDKLDVSVSGSAHVGLGGTAQAGTFSARGSSGIDAQALTVKAASIASSGPTTVRLTASETAKVHASGLAVVELSGKPACTIRPTSSAEVLGCR